MNDTIKSAGLYERGVFYFTNPTDRDFVAMWNSVEYKFPAKKTVPMLMNETPESIQEIRKRFAKKLHDREVMLSPEFLRREKQDTLTPIAVEIINQDFINSCLDTLPIADLESEPKETDIPEDSLSGNTESFGDKESVEAIIPKLESKKAKSARI